MLNAPLRLMKVGLMGAFLVLLVTIQPYVLSVRCANLFVKLYIKCNKAISTTSLA